jgi:phosphoglycerate-specific signal transduction histidine kinase
MTHSDIQQDIQSVQKALETLPFNDKSTLANASKELQELLHRVKETYQINLSSEHTSLKNTLDRVRVELEKEASYLSQSSGFRP